MVAPHLENGAHQHAVIQLTFSLDGNPFSVWTEEDGWKNTTAVLINSNIPHRLKDFKGWQVTNCIIPDITQGKLLQEKVLQGGKVQYFNSDLFSAFFPCLTQLESCPLLEPSDLLNLSNNLYSCILPEEAGFNSPIDPRILKALNYIQEKINHTISAAELAREVCLSEDRFLHLFKEQLGAPLRQFILWQRMAAAFKLINEGKSIKEAALTAGFSDPAHFSRTFVQNNGLTPSVYWGRRNNLNVVFFLSA